jgi:hypothetical protein
MAFGDTVRMMDIAGLCIVLTGVMLTQINNQKTAEAK